jgi:hypothetical protein
MTPRLTLITVPLLLALVASTASGQQAPPVPDVLGDYVAQRVAAIQKEQAARDAQLAQAAKVAADLAAQKPWVAPKVQPPKGQPNYVNLAQAGPGIRPQALPRALSFDESRWARRHGSEPFWLPCACWAGCRPPLSDWPASLQMQRLQMQSRALAGLTYALRRPPALA